MKKINHIISLGFFCSVALELEKNGYRDTSSPFDWCISDFRGVIDLINSQFKDFLEYEMLYQDSKNESHYKNVKYNISFFHDFSAYNSLDSQLPLVREKYNRRINMFYECIQEPTLFIRYISPEDCLKNGKSKELDYIEKNYDRIISTIKSFNMKNEIVFIANQEDISDVLNIYHVEKDNGDIVARCPFDKNEDILNMLKELDYSLREKNMLVYKIKNKQKNKMTLKIKRKFMNKYNQTFLKPYVHNRQY